MTYRCCQHCTHLPTEIHPDSHPIPCQARWGCPSGGRAATNEQDAPR